MRTLRLPTALLGLLTLHVSLAQYPIPIEKLTDEHTVLLDVDQFGEMSEGFATVTKNGKNALINAKGEMVIGYDSPMMPMGVFKHGLIAVKDVVTGKFGFMDTTLNVVIPCKFSIAPKFSQHGRFIISEVNAHGLVKPGEYKLQLSNGTTMAIPRTVNLSTVKAPQHPLAHLGYTWSEKHLRELWMNADVPIILNDFLSGSYARFKVTYNEILPPTPGAQHSSYDGTYYGFTDMKGNIVVQPIGFNGLNSYDYIAGQRLVEGRAWMPCYEEDQSLRWRCIDSTGTRVGMLSFANEPTTFRNGFSFVSSSGNSCGVVDLAGQIVHEFAGKVSQKAQTDADASAAKGPHIGFTGYGPSEEVVVMDESGPWRVVSSFTYQGRSKYICTSTVTEERSKALNMVRGTCIPFRSEPIKAGPENAVYLRADMVHPNHVLRVKYSDKWPIFTGFSNPYPAGLIDEQMTWVIPPVFEDLRWHDPTSKLTYTDVRYHKRVEGAAPEMVTLSGYINECGVFRLLKAEKPKW